MYSHHHCLLSVASFSASTYSPISIGQTAVSLFSPVGRLLGSFLARHKCCGTVCQQLLNWVTAVCSTLSFKFVVVRHTVNCGQHMLWYLKYVHSVHWRLVTNYSNGCVAELNELLVYQTLIRSDRTKYTHRPEDDQTGGSF